MRPGRLGRRAGAYRGVIFDLWETLIDWDRRPQRRSATRSAAIVGGDFGERWSRLDHAVQRADPRRRSPRPASRPTCMDEICALRLRHHRRSLVPRPGAVETLRRLRRDGYLVGLITVCSEDIETLWPESEFAGLFDAEVFSSRVGMSKPDPEIYLHCCELLGRRAARGGVRRRRRERRARRRAPRRHGCDPHPPRRRGPALAGARRLGRAAGHVDPGRARRARA